MDDHATERIRVNPDWLDWQAKIDELRVQEVLHAMNARNYLVTPGQTQARHSRRQKRQPNSVRKSPTYAKMSRTWSLSRDEPGC